MHAQYCFDRLDFHDYQIFHDKIHSVPASQLNAFVGDRQRHLPVKPQTGFGEFIAQAFLISRFKQAWS